MNPIKDLKEKIDDCELAFMSGYGKAPDKVIISQSTYDQLFKQGAIKATQSMRDLHSRDRLFGRYDIFMYKEVPKKILGKIKKETNGLKIQGQEGVEIIAMEFPITFARSGLFDKFKDLYIWNLNLSTSNLAQAR